MVAIVNILFLLVCLPIIVNSEEIILNEEFFLNVSQLIKKHGYGVEDHSVPTEDGYILSMQRVIPQNSASISNFRNNSPVLLVHGILGSAEDWSMLGPNKSLAYLLANDGYDVWLGNARGNTYSTRHKTLSPSDPKFWNFSWHEIGVYDLPAMIDHVLNTTGQESLFYIGHSQGTTTFFVMTSMRPEYNKKIRLMSAFAPVVYCSLLKSPIVQALAQIEKPLNNFLSNLIFKVGQNNKIASVLFSVICQVLKIDNNSICVMYLFQFYGVDYEQLDQAVMFLYLTNYPAGSSSLQLFHYAQMINSGAFRQYDHGESENRELYGQALPPSYDLSKVSSPVALYFSDNDWLANVKDVAQLAAQLPNLVGSFRVPFSKFNHIDYLLANEAPKLLYHTVIENMRSH